MSFRIQSVDDAGNSLSVQFMVHRGPILSLQDEFDQQTFI